MTINDFDVWLNGAPVIDKGDPDFTVWLNAAPVVDNTDEGVNPNADIRRRAQIF